MATTIARERFEVEMTAAEVEMVRELAHRSGVSSSEMIRAIVRRAYAEEVGRQRTGVSSVRAAIR